MYLKNLKRITNRGNVIFKQIEQSDEGDFINVSSKINKIAVLAEQHTTRFFSGGPDRHLISICARWCEVSANELVATLSLW